MLFWFISLMCSGKFSYKTGIISPANYPCLVRKHLPWHLHDSSMQQLYPCRYNFALLSSFDRYCCKRWNGSTAYRGFQRARETSFYMRRPERLTMFFRGTATYICNGKEIIPSKLIWKAWKNRWEQNCISDQPIERWHERKGKPDR